MDADLRGPEHLAVIDPVRCQRLLDTVRVGRLAFVDNGLPGLVILNHTRDGPDLIFRTSPDSRLAQMTDDGAILPVVFEVDSVYSPDRYGWSVIARGDLSQVVDADLAKRVKARMRSWAGGGRDLVLQLTIQELTGREVGQDAPTW
jgi:uncharacterized protein